MKWEHLIPGGKPTANHESRRDALKKIGVGAAALATGGFAASCTTKDLLNRPSSVAYAETMHDWPARQLLQDGEGFALERPQLRTPDILVIDGARGTRNWTVNVEPKTNDLYLNQAYLSNVTQLRFRRGSVYDDTQQPEEQGLWVQHDYRLELLDKNGHPLGHVNYGPVADNVNGDGALEKHDKFPTLHFFNSRGDVIDFKIDGDALVKQLPRAELVSYETLDRKEASLVPLGEEGHIDAHVPPVSVGPAQLQEIFEPYAAMRDRAKRDAQFEQKFSTDLNPVPLSQARYASVAGMEGDYNPRLLGNLAKALNAQTVEKAQRQSR